MTCSHQCLGLTESLGILDAAAEASPFQACTSQPPAFPGSLHVMPVTVLQTPNSIARGYLSAMSGFYHFTVRGLSTLSSFHRTSFQASRQRPTCRSCGLGAQKCAPRLLC